MTYVLGVAGVALGDMAWDGERWAEGATAAGDANLSTGDVELETFHQSQF